MITPDHGEPLYIPAEPGPLYGVLHRPAAGVPRAAILCLAPGLDERRSACGATARIARKLAAAGAAVLRFDYFGTGDSAGDSADVTLASMERDAIAAARFLRAAAPGAPLELLGVRLGASLALRAGASLGAARVAAVAPIIRGAEWLRQERGRSRLRRSMAAREAHRAGTESATAVAATASRAELEDLDGLPLAAEFVRELEGMDLLSGPGPVPSAAGGRPEILVVQVSPRRSPLPDLADLAARFGARTACLNVEPFWQPVEHPPVEALTACLESFLLGENR